MKYVVIISRTKHLLGSQHAPLQIVTLDTMCVAFTICVNYEDQLLPLVHQNWFALMARVDDRDLSVKCHVLKVCYFL
jgi:hypothetical protein